jgi:hypothetical protein
LHHRFQLEPSGAAPIDENGDEQTFLLVSKDGAAALPKDHDGLGAANQPFVRGRRAATTGTSMLPVHEFSS